MMQVSDMAFSEDGNTFVTVGNRSVKFWYFSGKSKVGFNFVLHMLPVFLNM